jgi:hypothetical protein
MLKAIFFEEDNLFPWIPLTGWANRTANAKVHSTTRLIPHEEWLIEKDFLNPFIPLPSQENPGIPYGVRKDNAVIFRGNRYALPTGTYQGP